ncbi:MAG: hypothetical protein U9N41_02845 [Euryarchaeota archaeon]|nr:hypothetical protein [Euryarchaeota archaeon]
MTAQQYANRLREQGKDNAIGLALSEATVRKNLMGSDVEVVENQIRENNPPETKKTLDRLLKKGYSKDDAMKLLGRVVLGEIYKVLKNKGEEIRQGVERAALEYFILLPHRRIAGVLSRQIQQFVDT